MAIFKIPKRVVNIIDKKIADLFDRIKVKFLGPRGADKYVTATHDKEISLPGMFEAASREEGGLPNIETLATMTDTSKNYIDALRLRTVNRVVKTLEEGANKPEDITNTLDETWKEATAHLRQIIESEVQSTKNIALLDGIIRTNASFGVDDPYVAFIIVRDENVCSECIRLHLSEDGVTPKVYKLSELNRGYHKKGMPVPSIHGLHPNCRCQLVTILPSYGFDDKGKVKYVNKGHIEYDHQRKE